MSVPRKATAPSYQGVKIQFGGERDRDVMQGQALVSLHIRFSIIVGSVSESWLEEKIGYLKESV